MEKLSFLDDSDISSSHQNEETSIWKKLNIFSKIGLIWIFFTIFFGLKAIVFQNDKNLIIPVDSNAPDPNYCGVGQLKPYPFLIFQDVFNFDWSRENICVNRCPKDFEDLVDCKTTSDVDR